MTPSADPALVALRARLARAALALPLDAPLPTAALGPFTLHPHQQVAVARLRRQLAAHRGALLADDVGLGKTLVALALVREAHTPLVVAPAAVRPAWTRAMRETGVVAPILSLESLGRRAFRLPSLTPDLLVVDEAHHARTPATRRWQTLATLAASARTLLLSATPIHNTPRDLAALLALFLGSRAHTLTPAQLTRHVVRRRAADLAPADPSDRTDDPAARRPRVLPTCWHPVPADPSTLAAIVALPPPLPPRDGAPADALHVHTLVRLWASSDGALRAALRRRLARATALAHALTEGRHLDRRTLDAWCAGSAGSAIQPDLFLDTPADVARLPAPAALLAHRTALQALLAAHRPMRDAARAALLRGLRARHPDARLVAFTQSADTARTLFRLLAPDGRVALLTAAGGRIASGAMSRRDLLVRFAPHAAGLPPPRAAERVDLLLATDCLSEGLDLRDASVVVHLDLPWTPARLAQRVGRCARPGAPHDAVHVHAVRPAPDEARWLRAARRLRTKARAARRTLGAHTAPSARLARHLERWLLAARPADASRTSRVLGVRPPDPAAHPGDALAALRAPDGATCLVAVRDGRVRTGPHALARATRWLDAARQTAPLPSGVGDLARRALRRWCRARRAADALHGGRPESHATPGAPVAASPVVRAALARLDASVRAAPAHRRAACTAAAAPLRARLAGPIGAGIERALAAALAPGPTPDADTWLATLRTVLPADDAAPRPADRTGRPPRWRLLALVVVAP